MPIIISDDIYVSTSNPEGTELQICRIGAISSKNKRFTRTDKTGELLLHPEEVKRLYKTLGELLRGDYKTQEDIRKDKLPGYDRDYITEFIERLLPKK